MKKVNIYTDGACSFNPGPGGWAAILLYLGAKKELSGGEANTTNNKMELQAVIEGLKALKKPCEVFLHSDSAYVVNAFEEGWLSSWQMSGWKTADKKMVKNVEQWQELALLCQKHKVKFVKVKGHANDQLNNRCDELARNEAQKLVALMQKEEKPKKIKQEEN